MERVDQAIELFRAHPEWDGTRGAAQLAKALGGRTNLGQATWLIVLNAVSRKLKTGNLTSFLLDGYF
jgi:hypothetical protein